MQEPCIIGVLAKPCGGKDTAVRMLIGALTGRGYAVKVFKFSDFLGEKLYERGIERTTANLQWVAQELVREEGEGAVARLVASRIEDARALYDYIIVNGVRWLEDEQLIRSFPNSILVYVKTPFLVRFFRKRWRTERVDDAHITLRRFWKEDHAPTERFIAQIGKNADVAIHNVLGLRRFRKQTNQKVLQRVA